MNRYVNAIAGRLSLRPPQRVSLGDRLRAGFSVAVLCAGDVVGKTRLMGGFISYLHLAHGINNFFVLAPNLMIYNKLITDFTPNTPKYVFKGIAECATDAPAIITGDKDEAPVFTKPEEQKVAQLAYDVIRKLENQPQTLPTLAHLKKPEIQAAIVKAVEEQHRPTQMELEGIAEKPDIAAVVAKTVEQILLSSIRTQQ